MDKSVVEKVLARANGWCEKCGGYLNDNYALHHRRLRSQGGGDCPENILVVHHECHNLGTNSIHLNPKEAKIKGWICPSWADPSEYPVHLPDGSIVRFTHEGNYKQIRNENGSDNS